MSQRDMQHQVTVDGGASATDGYSPAGEAPPPATRLLDLPPALLDVIACQVMQQGARSQLPLTSRAFSLAHLLHAPALRIHLGRQCCDQLLTPRVLATLQARTSKLALTLEQSQTDDSIYVYAVQFAPTLQLPQTEYTQDYTDLLAQALAKLDNCAAVEVCKLVSSGIYDPDYCKHLHCPPGLAQQLLDSFPSLTALTLKGLCVSSDALASLLSHPPLALQLQQLDIANITLPDEDEDDADAAAAAADDDDEEGEEEEEEPGAVGTLIQGLQLRQLSIVAVRLKLHGTPLLPSLQPLAQHLTQLDLSLRGCDDYGPDFFREYIQPLAQLQVLLIHVLFREVQMDGLTEVLQALPQLHNLQLPYARVRGYQQLDTLLAATQITSLQLGGVRLHQNDKELQSPSQSDTSVEALDTSYADAPCSLQRLELTGCITQSGIQYLPLHFLSQPLVLGYLHIGVDDIEKLEVDAALQVVAQVCKVPVQIEMLTLSLRSLEVITPALLQQQREDLAELVAFLQPLHCCDQVQVRNLHKVVAADVLALAPLCRDCTEFTLWHGSVEPSLEFWRQLLQLMPALEEIDFSNVEGCVSAAMHESLQLMAEQPWARWLHVILCGKFTASELPACWQAGSWLKTGSLEVTMYCYGD